VGHVRRLQNGAQPAIAVNEASALQAVVAGEATVIDNDHRQVGGLQIAEDAKAHAPQTAQDNGRLHAQAPSRKNFNHGLHG
jgi:hypothetical protein